MAINILNKRKQQEEQNQQQGQQGSTAPVFSSQSPGTAMQQPATQQKGSGFTNIQRIAQANQSARLGQTVGQGIQNIARSTQQQLGESQQKFQQESQQNRLGTEQDVARRQQVLERISQGGADVTPTEEELNVFEKFRRGQYTGPQGLANAENIRRQAQQAESLASATRSAGGRQALLQRFVGTPQYTQGQQRLDTTLLGMAMPQELSQARRSALGLLEQAQGQEQAAQSLSQYLGKQAQEFGQKTEEEVLGRAQNITSEAETLRKQREQQEVERRALFDQVRQDLDKGQISREDALRLGGQDFVDFIERGDYLYSTTPRQLINDYLKTEMGDRLPENISDVISKEQAARFNALARLAGQDPRFDLANVGQYKDSTQAFELAKLQDQITKDKARIEEEYRRRLAASRYGSNAQIGEQLSNLVQMGALGYGGVAGLSPEDIARYTTYGYTGGPDNVQQQNAALFAENKTKINQAFEKADQIALAQYNADPTIRSQYPSLTDYMGKVRTDALKQLSELNVSRLGSRNLFWAPGLSADVLNKYDPYTAMATDQVERELASERGQKLRFKETK